MATGETPAGEVALYDPGRHEPLRRLPWDENPVREAIERIVRDTEAHFTDERYWPLHPLDNDSGNETRHVVTPLYHGACGVIWALRYLQAVGAARLSRRYGAEPDRLLARNRAWLGNSAGRERASFMMGDTPIQMMCYGEEHTAERERALYDLIAGNIEHPARELMWGSPGTLLAALFLHERTGNQRWSDLFRSTADKLWSELEWSPRHRCSYWTQDLYGGRSAYLGAVHGFVATTLPLIRGRHLLDSSQWDAWERVIADTVERTADRLDKHANWRPELGGTRDRQKNLLQFCHGAPGFIICLAGFPTNALDRLLLAAGETIWSAGPLTKGSNLCHGTGGNGYAFLKLYQRTRDSLWLERARSFAMHGIAQTNDAALRYRQLRYSLWTGDIGFAIYLYDCLRAEAQFPTLDIFYGPSPRSGTRPVDPTSIVNPMDTERAPYHAHIYYELGDRTAAERLHREFSISKGAGELAGVLFVGAMRDKTVGPHPKPQFEVHFLKNALPRLLPLIRASGLTALVHPLTDDDLADHTALAMWIGEPLVLDATVLDPPGMNKGVARFGQSDV